MSTAVAEQVDDDLWSAIGDPTRRRMLDLLLVDGDGTATTLSEQLPVTRQAVAKHLGVLDRVGLVRATPAGREKRYRVDDAQLARAVAQLASVGSAWDARLRRIKRIAEAIQRTNEDRAAHETQTRTKENRDGGHPAPGRRRDLVAGEGLRRADDRRRASPAGGPTTRRGAATSAACSSSGSRRAASTWRSSSCEPAERVVWQVVDGPEEWIGTTIDWELRQDGDYTIVLFKHEGWREPVEFMHHCSTKWGSFLMSLKSLRRDRRRARRRRATCRSATGTEPREQQRERFGLVYPAEIVHAVGRQAASGLLPGVETAGTVAVAAVGGDAPAPVAPRARCRGKPSRRRRPHTGAAPPPPDWSAARPRSG